MGHDMLTTAALRMAGERSGNVITCTIMDATNDPYGVGAVARAILDLDELDEEPLTGILFDLVQGAGMGERRRTIEAVERSLGLRERRPLVVPENTTIPVDRTALDVGVTQIRERSDAMAAARKVTP